MRKEGEHTWVLPRIDPRKAAVETVRGLHADGAHKAEATLAKRLKIRCCHA